MSKTKDYIPTRDADFDGWFENLKNYIIQKTEGTSPEWAQIPQKRVTVLQAEYSAWHTAYEKTIAPHTPVDTEAKNDAKKNALEFVRPFVQQYLKFAPVTNEDRTAMRLHNKDITRTPIPVPATQPLITEIKPLGGFQMEIRFQNEATPNSRAIPYGDNGCLLNYAWGEEQITEYSKLTNTKLMTRSPWRIELPPETERKFLSCAGRWQNERGELGPWSEIQHAVIA